MRPGYRPPVLPSIDPERHWREISPGPEGDWGLEHEPRKPWAPSGGFYGIGRPGETWTDRVYATEPQPAAYMGPYAGLGPKGWRTDQRLYEEVCDALTRDPCVDASDIDVTVENGEVTLKGVVTDRFQKRQAERCVERVSGVRDVHNRLRVLTSIAAVRPRRESWES